MKIKELWFANERIYIRTEDGQVLWQSLLWYPRLRCASLQQRQAYEYDEVGIRWDEIDEDISVESFTYDMREPQGISRLFLTMPEVNASAVAQRAGIEPRMLAAYISGSKHPSPRHEAQIINALHELGAKLINT